MFSSRAVRCLALALSAVASVSCADVTGSPSPQALDSATLLPLTRTITMASSAPKDGAKAKAVRWGPSHNTKAQNRVSASIGKAGGTLSLPGSDFELIIPAGALAKSTKITVTAKGKHVEFDMQPHGLQFLKPVRAVLGLRNTASYGTEAGNVVRSAYVADSNEEINDDDSVSPAELPASTNLLYGATPVAETHIYFLNHFSRYILISGASAVAAE